MIVDILSRIFSTWAMEVATLTWLAIAFIGAIVEVSIPHFGFAFVSAGAIAAAAAAYLGFGIDPQVGTFVAVMGVSLVELRPRLVSYLGAGRPVAHGLAGQPARHRHARPRPDAGRRSSTWTAKTGWRAAGVHLVEYQSPCRHRRRHRAEVIRIMASSFGLAVFLLIVLLRTIKIVPRTGEDHRAARHATTQKPASAQSSVPRFVRPIDLRSRSRRSGQPVITRDNVTMEVDAVIYLKIGSWDLRSRTCRGASRLTRRRCATSSASSIWITRLSRDRPTRSSAALGSDAAVGREGDIESRTSRRQKRSPDDGEADDGRADAPRRVTTAEGDKSSAMLRAEGRSSRRS
jgi:hypothetical protein